MKKLVRRAALCGTALVLGVTAVRAVEIPGKMIDVKIGGDFVSSYIWRGSYQTGASMQPTLGFSVAGFSLTAWGSTDFRYQGHKEVDITAAYTIKGFTVAVTDYSWSPNGSGDYKYFNWQSHETCHYLEGSLAYVLPVEKFPLSINWNTMFFGADKKANGKTNYSTYVELAYPFSSERLGIDFTAAVGFTPWAAEILYGTKGFDVCNVSIGAVKSIRFSDKFAMPVFTKLIFNPARNGVYFVVGLTI